MRTLFATVFVTLLLLSPAAQAQRQPVPIIDYENIAVATTSGKALSLDEVRIAISAAAQSKEWEVTRPAVPDQLVAMLVVRNKHTIVVDIAFSPEKYSVKYKDSINMKFGKDPGGVRVIHPFYNRWVQELIDAIRGELRKL